MTKRLRWKFKDGSRRWWLVEAWDSGERAYDLACDCHDWVWEYHIYNDDYEQRVHLGRVTGQLDVQPRLSTLLLDWLSDLNSVVVEGCLNAEEQSKES